MVRNQSFFRMDRADGRIGGGTVILVAEKYDAQKNHKLNTPNIKALQANIATGGSRILVVGV